jgi:hypothetical protein
MMRAYIAILILAFSAGAFARQAVLGDSDVTITHVVPDPYLGHATMIVTIRDQYAFSASALPNSTDEGIFIINNSATANVVADRFIVFLISSAIAVVVLYQVI